MPSYILNGDNILPQLAVGNLGATDANNLAKLNGLNANVNNVKTYEGDTDVLETPKTAAKTALGKAVGAVATTTDNIISFLTAQRMTNKFDYDQDSYLIPIEILNVFVEESIKLAENFQGNTYSLAFRMYVGHDNNPSERKRVYNLVIVPVCTLLRPGGSVIHSEDKEQTLFGSPNNFFALALSEEDNIRVVRGTDGIGICSRLLANKDDVGAIPTQLIYHTHDDLSAFQKGLDINKEVHFVEIKFARTIDAIDPTKDNRLTIIIEFVNAGTGPVESTVTDSERTVNGICFDKGDLLPPPPLVDSFFIP